MNVPKLALSIPYLLTGVVLGVNDEYFEDVTTLSEVGSAIIAICAWPLIPLGVDLNIR